MKIENIKTVLKVIGWALIPLAIIFEATTNGLDLDKPGSYIILISGIVLIIIGKKIK